MLRVLLWALVLLVPLPAARAQEAKKAEGTGIKVEAELTADDPLDKARPTCHHKVHAFKMAAGKTYVIDMVTPDRKIDPYLRLEDSTGNQLKEDDDGGGFPNARITFKADKEGEYRIIATTYMKATGKYVLTVREASEATGALQGVKDEYQKAMRGLGLAIGTARTGEARQKLLENTKEQTARLVKQLNEFAEKYGKEPEAKEAERLAQQARALPGQVALALAERLRGDSQKAADQKDKAAAAKLDGEAEELLNRVVKDFADQPAVVRQAQDALFVMKNLVIGKVAPDIEGEDIDGKKFKLSDYRGKVVVLDFWGNW